MEVIVKDHTAEVIAKKNLAVAKALKEIGESGEGYAIERVMQVVYGTPETPHYKRTGDLLGSITHKMLGTNKVAIGAGINYAKYVELGTRKMAERPFIRPAVSEHLEEYKRIIESVLKSSL